MTTLRHGSTLRNIQTVDSDLCRLLIPGGPGIESPYLSEIIKSLKLKGNILAFDLPRPLSNNNAMAAPSLPHKKSPDPKEIVLEWKKDLIEALKLFKRTIIVAHSFGGMLAMATPEAAQLCVGAILLGTSPNRGWEDSVVASMRSIDCSEALKLDSKLKDNPTDEIYRELCTSWAPLYFLPEFRSSGIKLLSQTSYNVFPYTLSSAAFSSTYKNTWVQWDFPTLCLAGDQDHVTPLELFRKDKIFSEKNNVQFVEIRSAGHFPWVENIEDFKEAIQLFAKNF